MCFSYENYWQQSALSLKAIIFIDHISVCHVLFNQILSLSWCREKCRKTFYHWQIFSKQIKCLLPWNRGLAKFGLSSEWKKKQQIIRLELRKALFLNWPNHGNTFPNYYRKVSLICQDNLSSFLQSSGQKKLLRNVWKIDK